MGSVCLPIAGGVCLAVSVGYIGVTGGSRPLPPRAAASVGRTMGVEVMEVVGDSPAARTGFLPGDIILEADGTPIEDVADLQRLMVGEALGGPMRVLVWRGAATRTIEVQPTELEAA